MSKQYLNWFLKEHQMEELGEVLHNARRFYESTYGILKTVPNQMIFQNSLLECPPEKIIGLLHLLSVHGYERSLFWIAKLYFILPLPPDWVMQPTSFDTKKYFFQSLKSDFHPSIAYILFLIYHYRLEENRIQFVASQENHYHKNALHFMKQGFRGNTEPTNTFDFNPLNFVQQRFIMKSKIVAVSLAKEFKAFEKPFDFLLKDKQKLESFVLSIPQSRPRIYTDPAKKLKNPIKSQNASILGPKNKEKTFNITTKRKNFIDVIENKENSTTNKFEAAKKYYYLNSRRTKSHQISHVAELNNNPAQTLKQWNEPLHSQTSWATRLSMSTKVDRVLGSMREETANDIFEVHDRVYQMRTVPLKVFMQSATVNLTQKEVGHLKRQLQTNRVSFGMSKLWTSLGKVQIEGFGDVARTPMNQTGSRLIHLRK